MLLGTGPSFDSALKIFRANDNNIITCNSAIYENNLWMTKNIFYVLLILFIILEKVMKL